MYSFRLGEDQLTAERLYQLSQCENPGLEVEDKTWERVAAYRKKVDDIVSSGRRVYGINTGFGYLSNVAIENENLVELQVNLIRSHACGVGDFLSKEHSRALMILRAHTFCVGNSGVSPELIKMIIKLIELDILPCIPEKGSVGACGDLAPLAHMAMCLLGEGEVYFKGSIRHASDVFKELSIEPYTPKAKEGLSLINGTQVMTVIGAFALVKAKTVFHAALAAGAMSLDAIKGTLRAYDERIHNIRGQKGQIAVAAFLRSLFDESDEIMKSHEACSKVQDPYSFRCVPQVMGAALDGILEVERVVNIDLNAVTDNPLVFENGDVISGGNFHGEPVAIAMDHLSVCVAEIASISERRIEKLTNPNMSGLPAFVIENSGLNSGYMIPHVVAAALTSENKCLAHPASVDTIPTSADQEDHVSMGPIAARKADQIAENTMDVVAIELLASCQAIDILAPLKPSLTLQRIHAKIRELSPYMKTDRSLYEDIKKVKNTIRNGDIDGLIGASLNIYG